MRLLSIAALSLCPLAAWADAIENFPYPLVETTGAEAFAEWVHLRDEPGTPIIIGPMNELERVAEMLNPENGYGMPPPDEVLESAAEMVHPEALYTMREVEWRDFKDWAREKGMTDLLAELGDSYPPPLRPGELGEWDPHAPKQSAPYSTHDYSGQPHETIYIAILPTENAYEAPAYLLFGGWNANPAPDIHVTALKSWEDRYGAVPIVVSSDVIEMVVSRPPDTRQAAMDLAREQFLYNSDIVYQGVGTVSALGSVLIDAPLWYFWWD